MARCRKYLNLKVDYKPLLKQAEKFEHKLKNIIQQNNNNAMGLNDYAYIISERNHISINELKYALELAEQAMSIDPKNAAYLDTIGWIHYKMGTYEKAQKYLEKSITIDQNNPVILEHMGDIYHQLGISGKALIHYKKALEQDSNNIIIQDKIDKLHGK